MEKEEFKAEVKQKIHFPKIQLRLNQINKIRMKEI